MPELPEVETVVRGLRAILPERTVVAVRLGKTDFMDDSIALAELLPGRRIVGVDRFGKFIDVEMEPCGVAQDPGQRLHLILHLGMSGRLAVQPAGEPPARHTHAFFELDDGRELRFTDPRRFGRILVLPESKMPAFRARLGAEPMEISLQEFRRRLAGRRSRIKALLLDQHVLCGLGNIYVDESLWLARIHPARLAARLHARDLARLRAAIRHVLRSAIRLRGSSISDFLDAEGNPGEYQRHHRVYHRHGRPCCRCGSAIRRVVVAGRSSHFCPRCQAPPRRIRVREVIPGSKAKPQRGKRLREPPLGLAHVGRPAARGRESAWQPASRVAQPAGHRGHGDFGALR